MKILTPLESSVQCEKLQINQQQVLPCFIGYYYLFLFYCFLFLFYLFFKVFFYCFFIFFFILYVIRFIHRFYFCALSYIFLKIYFAT